MGLGTKAYDPAQVLVTVAGIELKGFAPGSKIKLKIPKIYNKVVGLDGEVGRGKNNNKTISGTFSLMQTSDSNRTLMTLFGADDAAPSGVLVPFFLKNLNGETLIASPATWFELPEDVEYGPEVGTNEWSFECGETVTFLGGQAAIA